MVRCEAPQSARSETPRWYGLRLLNAYGVELLLLLRRGRLGPAGRARRVTPKCTPTQAKKTGVVRLGGATVSAPEGRTRFLDRNRVRVGEAVGPETPYCRRGQVQRFVTHNQLADNQTVNSRRGSGVDIHEVSGSGSCSASPTVSQPFVKGIELFVPLRVIHSNLLRCSHVCAICIAVCTSCAT